MVIMDQHQSSTPTVGCSRVRTIVIRSVETVVRIRDKHTVYKIDVFSAASRWTISKRYSQFHDLHTLLVLLYPTAIPADLLPKKRFLGIMTASVIAERRCALEHYLRALINHVDKRISDSQPLFEFLEVERHEVVGLTSELSAYLYSHGDNILELGSPFVLPPRAVTAVCRRLRLPNTVVEPVMSRSSRTKDSSTQVHVTSKTDLGHLFSFVKMLRRLTICASALIPGTDTSKAILLDDKSNIFEDFDISIFSSLRHLSIEETPINLVEGIGVLYRQLETVRLHKCLGNDNPEIFFLNSLVSYANDQLELESVCQWAALTVIDLSGNSLSSLDRSVLLWPVVSSLTLAHNCFNEVPNVHMLHTLTYLDLSYNHISALGSTLNNIIGNLSELVLSHNAIEHLSGIENILSLEKLDLSFNRLSELNETNRLGKMPVLESLIFSGNPFCEEKAYRVHVLSYFSKERRGVVSLDNNVVIPGSKEANKIETMAGHLLLQLAPPELFPAPSQVEINGSNKYSSVTPSINKYKQNRNSKRVVAIGTMTENTIALDPSQAFFENCSYKKSRHEENDEIVLDAVRLRGEVESIRELGGTSWLKILDEIILSHEPVHGIQSSKSPKKKKKKDNAKTKTKSCSPTEQVEEYGDITLASYPTEWSSTLKQCVGLVLVAENSVRNNDDYLRDHFMVQRRDIDNIEASIVLDVDIKKLRIIEIDVDTGRKISVLPFSSMKSYALVEDSPPELSVLSTDGSLVYYMADDTTTAATLFALFKLGISSAKMMEISENDEKPLIPSAAICEQVSNISRNLCKTDFDSNNVDHSVIRCANQTQPLNNGLSSETVSTTKAGEELLNFCRTHLFITSCEKFRYILCSTYLKYGSIKRERDAALILSSQRFYILRPASSDLAAVSISLSSIPCTDMKCIARYCVRNLKQVVVGLFDQKFRLEFGPSDTYTFLTREYETTSAFMDCLTCVLDALSPVATDTYTEDVVDLYVQDYEENGSRMEFTYPNSNISFIYPNDDTLERLREHIFSVSKDELCSTNNVSEVTIISYLLIFFTSTIYEEALDVPRTLILTNERIYVVKEDHVSWPIPLFASTAPMISQYESTYHYNIGSVIGVEEWTNRPCHFSLLFEIESSSTILETSTWRAQSPSIWEVRTQTAEEKTIFLRLLGSLWKQRFQNDLQHTVIE